MKLRWVALVALLLLIFFLPLLAVLLGAFSPRWVFPDLLPRELSFRGVLFLRSNSRAVIRALGSSLRYSLASVVTAFLLCLGPAEVLARYRFRGRLAVEALLLSPVLIPAITWALGLSVVLIRVGLADTFPGVVIVLTAASYPYMLRALIAGFQQLPRDYRACAVNLGASPLRQTLLVTIPMLMPAIVAGGTVVFLVAFSDYFLVFLVGGGAVQSFTGYLFPYLSAADYTIGSTLTLLFLLVPMTLFGLIELTVGRWHRRWGQTGG